MRNLILQLEEAVLRYFIECGYHENSNGYDWWAAPSRVFPPEDREVAKAVMRNLVAKGEAAVGRGVVDEYDGLLVGSGWYITKKGQDRVKAADLALPLPGQTKEGDRPPRT